MSEYYVHPLPVSSPHRTPRSRPEHPCRGIWRPRRRNLPRSCHPGVGGNDQDAQPALEAPERDRLLVAAKCRGDVPWDVAQLERPVLVPDGDCVGVVLVVGLSDERKRPRGFEGRIVERLDAIRDARDRHDCDAGILPTDRLTRLSVSQVIARLARLEPEAKAPAQNSSSFSTASTTRSTDGM
jgi:hypothetical protein